MESLLGFGYPVYLLIAEYDNFANTMMMSTAANPDDYKELVREEGLLRTLFKAVKALTSKNMFDRVFITGVSPVVLSDITSGYNIAESIYLEPELNNLCGFKEDEVKAEIHNIVNRNKLDNENIKNALHIIKTYYNGYLFSPENDEFIYNPTMCIYFFKQFQKKLKYPREMLDSNLTTDQAKLNYIAKLNCGNELILNLLEKNNNTIITRIVKSFGIDDMLLDNSKDKKFLSSFLYYFGILTIAKETDDLQIQLKIPNMVAKSLYAEKICSLLGPEVK